MLRRAMVAAIIYILVLVACGSPAATPTANAPATQTRVGELAILATAAAPTTTPTVTLTATPTNTATPIPTATATATPVPPTFTPTRTATRPPLPTATPTPTKNEPVLTKEQVAGQYPVLTEPREIAKSPTAYTGKRLVFVGIVLTIRTASEGNIFRIEGFEARTYLQVTLFDPLNNRQSDVTVFVLYDGDTTGLFDDDVVSVYAVGKGTYTFQNALGGTVTQALFYANYIEYEQ